MFVMNFNPILLISLNWIKVMLRSDLALLEFLNKGLTLLKYIYIRGTDMQKK